LAKLSKAVGEPQERSAKLRKAVGEEIGRVPVLVRAVREHRNSERPPNVC
jgi:hypothetical protein